MSTCKKQALQENYYNTIESFTCILLYVLCWLFYYGINLKSVYYNKLSYYSWYLLFKSKELIVCCTEFTENATLCAKSKTHKRKKTKNGNEILKYLAFR